MARKDFAERFQKTYCQNCGRELLNEDGTKVLHDPWYCKDKQIGLSYDEDNGGRWEQIRGVYGGGADFYPRLLSPLPRFCRCGRELSFCACTESKAIESHRRMLEEREKIRRGELRLLPLKYGPCLCDRYGRTVPNCMCEFVKQQDQLEGYGPLPEPPKFLEVEWKKLRRWRLAQQRNLRKKIATLFR